MVLAESRPRIFEPKEAKSFNSLRTVVDVPNLVQVQINSFDWLKADGLKELFDEISPIEDFSGGRFELRFLDHEIRTPKLTERECRQREITYSAPLYVTVQLVIKATGEVKEQVLFFGDVPMMTPNGTFVINGAERVVVSQLVRSPGAYFTSDSDPTSGRALCSAKLIPYRGAWVELETSNRDLLSVKVDRKRKAPISTFLRALGWETDDEIRALFKDVDTDQDRQFIESTLARDSAVTTQDEALLEFYRRLRPGEPPSIENARSLIDGLFFNERKYDLGRVGRYKLNRRLGINVPLETKTLTKEDIIEMISRMIRINNGEIQPDDIDHLGNRRVRAVGELIQNQLRVGLLRMERVVKERMTTQMDPAATTPAALINIRPVVAAVREFFGGSQLSQFMDQTNPLAELTHKRRLSALGPGGLSRERAGFDVRDVHHSHYGRICPIETPEGPNIGLLGSLSTYARINDYGFIETPYQKVLREISSDDPDISGRIPVEDITNKSGKVIAEAGRKITAAIAEEINALPARIVPVKPYVSASPDDIQYLSADAEEEHIIGQATTETDNKGQFSNDQVEVRLGEGFTYEPPENVELMDISPMQIVSVSTALIPFLEHDDANRALMGSNMQRQAVPLLKSEAPLVGTGMERRVAMDSGQVVLSLADGIVVASDAANIKVMDNEGKVHEHPLTKFVRSNQGTCINQHPIVTKGQVVKKGDPLADSASTDLGELALGQNLTVGFMSWEGYNFEDAIIINQDLVKNDRFTSIHIEKHEVEARETKLGPEEITRDIPNVGEESLRDLDDEGVVRIGAYVGPGDILVGKITPKGETELTAEEKLLRAIFGEKARDVKDTSLRVPHGQHGKVINIRVMTKENGDELPPGVMKMVRVWVAHTRKITQGDKMAGRHGNKGVVARIMPREDMPFLPDGTPLDIVLNPIGVPSRMNLGQLLETHLGAAARTLGFNARTPVFDGAKDVVIEDQLARAWFVQESEAIAARDIDRRKIDWKKVDKWLSDRGFDRDRLWSDAPTYHGVAREACLRIWLRDYVGQDVHDLKPSELMAEALRLAREKKVSAPIFGKSVLYDGRTGDKFDQPITVGTMYMLKLIHLVEDKIHARSTGPYSLITQQPLGGKAQFGGQRFGEMEVWALEAYSAAYTLQEMLTIKSDDVVGRVKTYEAIVKGEEVIQPGVPESFHVLLKELQGLGLSVELLNQDFDQAASDSARDESAAAALGAPLSWEDFDYSPLDLDEDDDLLDDDDEDSGLSDDVDIKASTDDDDEDDDSDDDEEDVPIVDDVDEEEVEDLGEEPDEESLRELADTDLDDEGE
jgi:DNA-directed RNA polymerase subunit beta